MQVSSAFVVIMGMGVTFVGLTCIIFLTILMGKILSMRTTAVERSIKVSEDVATPHHNNLRKG